MKLMSHVPPVRIRFPVLGSEVPIDHYEALYASLSRNNSQFHQLEGLSVSPITGGESAGEVLRLTKDSCLYFQMPYESLNHLVQLAGKRLQIGDKLIRLGVPHLIPLNPHPRLYSRFVTIKNALTEEVMRSKVQEQLLNMDITLSEEKIQVLRRRVITIHDRKIVGFGILLEGLDDEASIKVQLLGVGGRRRYSSGFFLPVKGDHWDE
ncbi:putative CRISPR-associated endonuclease Cas6 [[Clostridium] ultunense Esp]|nr:putative CRISPR-associated endonuclease Cas6 [[Clostridium] ultunense Esp]